MVGKHDARAGRAGVLLVALTTAACGAAAPNSPSQARRSSPTATTAAATPSPEASSCSASDPAAVGAVAVERIGSPWMLQIVGPHGAVLNRVAVDPVAGLEPIGTGCRGVYLYDHETATLELLGLDGAPQMLAHLGSTATAPVEVVGAAESPDASRWIYSAASYTPGGYATSNIYAAAIGATPTLVKTLSRPNASSGGSLGGYRVLRWDAAGVLLGTAPTDVGGAGPFIDEGYDLATVVRLDLDTASVSTPLTCGGRGRFADVASDGTQACISHSQIVVMARDGSFTTVTNSGSVAGQVAFLDGSSCLTWSATSGIASSPSTNGPSWQDTLYAVSLPAAQPSKRVLLDSESHLENGSAIDKVVDSHTLAEITGQTGSTSLSLVDVRTGHAVAIAPADVIVGAL